MPQDPQEKKTETTRRKASEYGEASGRKSAGRKKPSASELDRKQRDKSTPRRRSGPPLQGGDGPIAEGELPYVPPTEAEES